MNNKETIKSKQLFNNIINKGNKVSNDYYTIFFIEKENINPLFGVAVSKKSGNAVIRNKLKRQARELIRHNKILFKNNKNYIIIIKKKSLEVSFQDKEEKFINLVGEIK